MKNEMDVMKMDERQRLNWLFANRLTLFLVGIVWLSMIGWELLHHRTPWLMIAMVPVLALIRALFYFVYSRKAINVGDGA